MDCYVVYLGQFFSVWPIFLTFEDTEPEAGPSGGTGATRGRPGSAINYLEGVDMVSKNPFHN